MVLFLSILIGMMSGGLITGIKRWSSSLNKTKLHFAIDYTIGVGSGIIGAIIVNHFFAEWTRIVRLSYIINSGWWSPFFL